ncbi:MAG: PD-(D/E)XK motif protein, partial [Proteobacteria bacterium]
FQFGRWAIEAKTSKGNNHQKVTINGERQLDTTNFESLFLYHLSLEELQRAGQTLNQIVDEIRVRLIGHNVVLTCFECKLIEASYFDHHRELYEYLGYLIRSESCYKVESSFPRFEEKDIPSGVGDVKYSITLSQCSPFLVTRDQMFNSLSYE